MRIEHTTEIAAPVSTVWELTLDVESLPEITPTITEVERLDDGPIGVGSATRLKQPGQRPRVWTVTELEPEHRFAWSTRVLGTEMTGAHVLSVSESGTKNTLTVDIDGPLAPIVGALVRRPILKAIATENQGFKEAAEGQSPERSEPASPSLG